MNSITIKTLLLGALALGAEPVVTAQNAVPATQFGAVVFGNQDLTLDTSEGVELNVPTYARYDFAVSSTDWLKATATRGGIKLDIADNPTAVARKAMLTLRSNNGVSTSWTVTQPGWSLANEAEAAVNATRVKPVRTKDACKKDEGKAQEPLRNSYDGDMNTLYHSNYGGFDPADPSQWPVLEYYFTKSNAPSSESVEIASITYNPRTSGGENGRFGLVKIEVATMPEGKTADADLVWTPIQADPVDFKKSASARTVKIPDAMQKGIRAIRFTVQTGDTNRGDGRNYASCAEMEFNLPAKTTTDMQMFADDVCSALKPGTTQADIDAMTDPFLKGMAQMMLNGTYKSDNLVSTHNAIKDPYTLSEEMQSPGKCYDKSAGVTGVVLTPGKYVILVSGISENKGSVEMHHIYWHGHEQFKDEQDNNVSWYCEDNTYTLHNGVNIVDITMGSRQASHRVKGDDMGLVYINNFDDEAAAAGRKDPVTVHIVGGIYNGYLSATKTNAENKAVLDNAAYECMDVVGSRVHGVWQTGALKTYADGQWVRYCNLLDQLIIWEHRVLGLEKYNRVPENRTMTYVNYNYYMYQGGRGPTFMYDTQSRVCSPDNLIYNDNDAIWGLSHEWGHQHQMAPYFRWTGMAEVSNNIFSAYNVIHMGYPISTNPGRYPTYKWQEHTENGKVVPGRIQSIFLDDVYDRTITPPDKDGETKTCNNDGIVMSLRADAAKAAKAGNAFWWCDELKEFAQNQPMYPSKRFESAETYSQAAQNTVNPRTAVNAIEAYSSGNGELILGPYVNLMYYFEQNGNPELWPDLFESMRQNDDTHGSTVEKGKTEVDKYELLVSIFNNNKTTDPSINKRAQFKEMFPTSCWTTKGYVGGDNDNLGWSTNSVPAILNCIRKLSLLSGYNLWSYFERFGVFTVCAIEQGDYGIQHYIMTDAMYDEFKADMDALETSGRVKPLTEEMRQAISTVKAKEVPAPNIPNDRPVLPSDN